jgi:hypothetical protein
MLCVHSVAPRARPGAFVQQLAALVNWRVCVAQFHVSEQCDASTESIFAGDYLQMFTGFAQFSLST